MNLREHDFSCFGFARIRNLFFNFASFERTRKTSISAGRTLTAFATAGAREADTSAGRRWERSQAIDPTSRHPEFPPATDTVVNFREERKKACQAKKRKQIVE